jgi:hypothetical protein
VFLLFLGGCLPSFYPLFTPDQYILNEELMGTWQNEDGTFVFEPDTVENTNRYLITQTSTSGDTARFYASMGKLDSNYFLDLSLRDLELGETWASLHVMPVHTFSKIEFTENKLRISMYNESWLKKRIKQRYIRIKYEEKADGSIMLTAPTVELQKFVLKYADEDDAFIKFETLTKISDT